MINKRGKMTDNFDLDEVSEASVIDNEPILRKDINVDDFDIPTSTSDLEAVYNIPVKVSAVLGKTSMKVSQLMKLNKGAIIELDRKVGEAIDIYVNNSLVARGEVVVVDEKLGITMTEIVKAPNK
jgi:flagellar motor switch protein FliN/FliY